jgi:hypothetical protein
MRFAALLCTASALVLTCTPAHAELLYATSGNDLARFDSGSTGVVTSVPVTGLQAGDSLVGIDVRPANQVLYGVGSSSSLYRINPLTGAALQVGPRGAFTLNGTSFGVDINPVADRLRVVSNTGQSLRLNLDNVADAVTDTAITPAGVTATGLAYSANGAGATSTTLYAIDAASGQLSTLGGPGGTPSPNGGVVSAVGPMGLGTNLDPRLGFDITGVPDTAYATILTGGTDKLYRINLGTGAATLVGTIGTGTTVYSGLTAATAVPEPAAALLAALAGAGFLAHRRRAQ